MTDTSWLIGDVARQTGVSVDTVRFYERKGLLGEIERDGSGYRRYDTGVVHRIRVIRHATEIGFSLEELAKIFRLREAGQPPCRTVRALAEKKLAGLEERIATMVTLRDRLTALVQLWDAELGRTATNAFAHLLDALVPSADECSSNRRPSQA